MIRFVGGIIRQVLKLGIPIAFQDLLVGFSFLVIQAVVNALGVTASAGVGVAEKVCGFIMLVPAAFMQSISAFVAQNIGAGKPDRYDSYWIAAKRQAAGKVTRLSNGVISANDATANAFNCTITRRIFRVIFNFAANNGEIRVYRTCHSCYNLLKLKRKSSGAI